MAMRKPNLIRVVAEGSQSPGGTVVSDGEKLYMYFPNTNMYAVGQAPADLDEMAAGGLAAGPGSIMNPTSLFSRNPYAVLMGAVSTADYGGVEEIAGAQCHHLRFSGEVIEVGKSPVKYGKVDTDRAQQIIDRHLKKGQVIQEWLID